MHEFISGFSILSHRLMYLYATVGLLGALWLCAVFCCYCDASTCTNYFFAWSLLVQPVFSHIITKIHFLQFMVTCFKFLCETSSECPLLYLWIPTFCLQLFMYLCVICILHCICILYTYAYNVYVLYTYKVFVCVHRHVGPRGWHGVSS